MNRSHKEKVFLAIEHEPNKFKYVQLSVHKYRHKYKNAYRPSKDRLILSRSKKEYGMHNYIGEVNKRLINSGLQVHTTFHASSNYNFDVGKELKDDLISRPYTGNSIRDVAIFYAKVSSLKSKDRATVKKKELIRKAYKYSKRYYTIHAKADYYNHKQSIIGNVAKLRKELNLLGHVIVRGFSESYWNNSIEFSNEEQLKRVYIADENKSKTKSLYDIICLKMMLDSAEYIRVFSNEYFIISVKRNKPTKLYIEDHVPFCI